MDGTRPAAAPHRRRKALRPGDVAHLRLADGTGCRRAVVVEKVHGENDYYRIDVSDTGKPLYLVRHKDRLTATGEAT